ncbi:hypothetical protein ACET3X_004450 [Alternaria dauci]|uniref:Ubiquitin-like protease family profile domain-containing protein n=1 Tax=Alternaria dauci TaxID=48095 RepID=A0ABR3UND0_9PLEO
MVAPNEVSDDRMPAQVTAQVAPTSLDSSIPHPDSSSRSPSTSFTTSQTAEMEPLVHVVVPEPTSQPDSDSLLDSSAVDVGSPQGTESHIEIEGLASPPAQSDPITEARLPGDTSMCSHSQEGEHTDITTPITLPCIDDVGNKMSTTPPTTPPLVEQAETPRSSPNESTAPPTPSTTAPSSGRAPSALQVFESRSNQARQEHFRRTKIFHKTRSAMVCQTNKMLVFASRGFERKHLPTRRTKPPLLKRRYSIDVNTTKEWGTQKSDSWQDVDTKVSKLQPHAHTTARSTNIVQEAPLWLRNLQTETPYLSSTHHSLPDPCRYAAFGPVFYTGIPHNTDTFLELGDVTLQNDAFNYIGATSYAMSGMEVWMRGESLDMALEVLRRDADCDAYGIGIANSTVAQICHFASAGIDGPSGEYDQYRARYSDKNWIFLVCNDGMGGVENNGTSGSHWSMVAMDRISKRAYYYDSMWVHRIDYQNLGRDISLGMLHILGEDIGLWRYDVQHGSPDQNDDNLFKQDGGACGPFVYKMTQILIRHIKAQQSLGFDQFSLDIDREWSKHEFARQFHSGSVRRDMQDNILRWRHITQAVALADEYDHQALRDTDAVLDDGPIVSFEIPPRPQLPVLRRTRPKSKSSRSRHTKRGRSNGSSYHDPIDLEDSDENWTTHDDSSDNSTAGSSGGDTVIDEHEVLWEDAGVDMDMGDDDNLHPGPEGGIQLIEEPADV